MHEQPDPLEIVGDIDAASETPDYGLVVASEMDDDIFLNITSDIDRGMASEVVRDALISSDIPFQSFADAILDGDTGLAPEGIDFDLTEQDIANRHFFSPDFDRASGREDGEQIASDLIGN